MVALILMYMGLALLMAVLSVPMMRGLVKPNWLYGFRTPSTINDPDLWYAANAYAGRLLFRCALVFLLAAALFPLIPGISTDAYALSVASVLLVSMIAMLVLSFRFLRGWRDGHSSGGGRK